MNDTNEKEIKLINGQIIGIFLFIITLLVSILISYNEKLQRENKRAFFSNKEALDISFINRLVVVLIGIYFVYDAYARKNNAPQNDPDSNLEILSSWFALIASIIVLYIVIRNYNNPNFDVTEIEEPTL